VGTLSEGLARGMEALQLPQREIVAPKIGLRTFEAQRDTLDMALEILGQKGGARTEPLARCCWCRDRCIQSSSIGDLEKRQFSSMIAVIVVVCETFELLQWRCRLEKVPPSISQNRSNADVYSSPFASSCSTL